VPDPRAGLKAGPYKRYAIAMGIAAAWLGLAVLAVVYIGGAIVAAMARGLALLPRGVVWLFLALQQGADWWSIAGRVGAVLADTITTSQVGLGLIALELVGAAALYGLQRLLRDEARRPISTEERRQGVPADKEERP
jgi:hypothetical protein